MVDLAIFGVSMRCGSTLVQRVFNLNPGTLVWGENGRMLMRYLSMRTEAEKFCQAGMQERIEYFSKGRFSDVFTANINPDWEQVRAAMDLGLKVTLSAIYSRGPYGRVGFKEVGHYIRGIDLLESLFPEIKIYFCGRNPLDTWLSLRGWDDQDLSQWLEGWLVRIDSYLSFAHCAGFFWYEDLLYRPDGLRPLAEAAGVQQVRVQELVELGRVGGTSESVKREVPRDELEFIRNRILAMRAGPHRDQILEVSRLAGHPV